jgi:hypothetical protein
MFVSGIPKSPFANLSVVNSRRANGKHQPKNSRNIVAQLHSAAAILAGGSFGSRHFNADSRISRRFPEKDKNNRTTEPEPVETFLIRPNRGLLTAGQIRDTKQ